MDTRFVRERDTVGLPRIGSYTLPAAQDIPASRVTWAIDARRAALLVHDMQNYFVGAYAPDAPPIAAVIANIATLRDACDHAGIPVFYTAQPGTHTQEERGLQADFWGPGMTSAPEHRDIVPALAPRPSHRVLTKWRYSAFQRTSFAADLIALGRDQLIVTGIYASIGCLLSAADAFMYDVQPFMVADAVADFSRARHDLAMQFAAERFAAPIMAWQAVAALTVPAAG